MTRTIETDAQATKEYEEGRKGFEAVPTGNYDFTIKQVEEVKFAKEGPNARPALNVQLRIVDDAPQFGGRVFFIRVPLFHKFAATGQGKYPDGSPAFLHFQFYEALGIPTEQINAGQLPDDRELLGKRIGGRIKFVPADPNSPYDSKRVDNNEVTSVFASKTKAPVAGERALPVDPFAAAPTAPTAAAPSTPDPWAVAPADQGYADAVQAGEIPTGTPTL